ncbi:MAG: kinase [Clostridia bacterium]|nr:kinase [Clostridia bacterium]
MNKLILLRGNSGSGKTSAARVLQKRFGFNTMLISHDMVRMQMLHVWGKDGIAASQPLLIELVRYGKEHSQVTILEGVLDSKEYRELFDVCAELFGKEIYAYYYDLPFEETLLRHQTKANHNDFGEADMRRWWREKDVLPMIPETILTQEITLEEAVEQIYQKVTS